MAAGSVGIPPQPPHSHFLNYDMRVRGVKMIRSAGVGALLREFVQQLNTRFFLVSI